MKMIKEHKYKNCTKKEKGSQKNKNPVDESNCKYRIHKNVKTKLALEAKNFVVFPMCEQQSKQLAKRIETFMSGYKHTKETERQTEGACNTTYYQENLNKRG